MILKDGKIYANGLLHKGSILINSGIIEAIKYNPSKEDKERFIEKNQDGKVIDCVNKLILPGIIDIHSHLRDMEQSQKETFLTGTKAAAYSGITTVFNMPNTIPPAIDTETVIKWMNRAKNNIYINVGFIAGVPKSFNEEEIKKIISLGVFGFKIYPLKSLNSIDWQNESNIQKLLSISSKYHIPIFIHPDKPLLSKKRLEILDNWFQERYSILKLHNKIYPPELESAYITFIIDNYLQNIESNKLTPNKFPIVHFCHVSCKSSYEIITQILKHNTELKISFEVTPHHLLLSNEIPLKKETFGKVLPPLREEVHTRFLFEKFKEGKINLIGTDHAPHTKEEKSDDYLTAPSGFPGFETYPLMLLNKVCHYELSLENFVKAASENPARIFNLKNKGFIKEGSDADLLIVDKIPEYQINPAKFKSKAKFSPYENYSTTVLIWKVFLKGIEINKDDVKPTGKIITRSR